MKKSIKIVPTVNAANPNIDQILSKGIKKDVFTGIYVTGTIRKIIKFFIGRFNK